MTAEARLSSKGQVVIPKEMREKLGLKVGDKLRFEITPEKVLTISSTAKPPEDAFVQAGSRITQVSLREAARLDEGKTRRLLAALGAKR